LGSSDKSQAEAKKKSASASALASSTSSEGKGQESLGVTALALPAAEAFLTVMLSDGSEFPISDDKVLEWILLYPGVDVRQELRAYKAWAINNPKRRKTSSGIFRSINFWLGRAQNEAGPTSGERNNGANISTAGPATIRQRRSDDAIDAAAKFLSNPPSGCVDEASKGELSRDGDFSRNGSSLARPVGRDRPRLQSQLVHSRSEAMLQGNEVLPASR
jgi:hypothetical protein